ncbi:RNase2 complex protein, Ydr279, putative [Bodo saltans]|uniref:RNase2 complex protein, Ydr279, putative n=1 Tax=Bodo saltans TaxID=75058 RepID=A0A0S4IKK5_BODSA|nr:RNase2 complex protein, Ydr279, putative [Bodo saltans]|eukprot:CUF09693.1 RNase2 complex protein, Ydr279, putative [Bodo saltans]
MGDDEYAKDIGTPIEGVKFSADDPTVSIPFPEKHVFILPQNLDSIRLWSLPHPRHGELCCYLTGRVVSNNQVESSRYVLCEVQERRHSFADMWFLGEHVEPASGLRIATPIDATFFALALARKGGQADKFVTAEDIMSTRDTRIAALPKPIMEDVEKGLKNVCDVKSFGPDETYYRYSEAMFQSWIRRKHNQLLAGKALAALLGIDTAAGSTGDEQLQQKQQQVGVDTRQVLKAKGLALLNEYLHSSLHTVAAVACGVEEAPAPSASGASRDGSAAASSSQVSSSTNEPLVRKPSAELKSASVKRLEKAGPPKGTPTLMAMFAKKKQQQEKL